jgi:hypothetical protein
MTKRLLATGLLVWLLALCSPAAALAAPRTLPSSRTVLLVLAPYLRWEDVTSGRMPNLQALAARGAVGNLNVRSLLPRTGQPSPEGGALMLSAGTWARYYPVGSVPVEATGSAEIGFPGFAVQQGANSGDDIDTRLGTLGGAIEDAGGSTAAIGNADGRSRSRPAALLAMDRRGDVRFGDISTDTVMAAARAPLGRISDATRIQAELARVLGKQRAGEKPALIVVDPGDLARAHASSGGAPEGLARPDRIVALRAFDALVGSLPRLLPKDTLLVVAAPVAAQDAGAPSGFGPIVISAEGGPYLLTSASTHRGGLVTNADLTATILSVLGIRRPLQVAGSTMSLEPDSRTAEQRLSSLDLTDGFMRAVDTVRTKTVGAFILAAAALLVLTVGLLMLPRLPVAVARLGRVALLALVAVPLAGVLMYVVHALPQSPALVRQLLAGTLAALVVLVLAVHRGTPTPRMLATLALATTTVILVDQWLGAPLSLDGLLGYSPLVGARYYGIGNEGAAVLVGAALTGCALVLDAEAARAWAPAARRWGVAVLGVLVVATAAAPVLGANIGVAIWGTFAFGLAWWGMAGRKVGWKAVAALVLGVVVLIAAFAAVDMLGLGGGRTHLARAVVSGVKGGPGELWTIVVRKAALNVKLLLSTSWSLLFGAMVASLVYVRLWPRGALRDMLDERPDFSAVLSATLVAGFIAYFTEDSGVVVPALLLLFPTVAVLYLMLGRRAGVRE